MCGDVLLMCLAGFFDMFFDVQIFCHKFDVLFDVLGMFGLSAKNSTRTSKS